jgi:hypothetical protein
MACSAMSKKQEVDIRERAEIIPAISTYGND